MIKKKFVLILIFHCASAMELSDINNGPTSSSFLKGTTTELPRQSYLSKLPAELMAKLTVLVAFITCVRNINMEAIFFQPDYKPVEEEYNIMNEVGIGQGWQNDPKLEESYIRAITLLNLKNFKLVLNFVNQSLTKLNYDCRNSSQWHDTLIKELADKFKIDEIDKLIRICRNTKIGKEIIAFLRIWFYSSNMASYQAKIDRYAIDMSNFTIKDKEELFRSLIPDLLEDGDYREIYKLRSADSSSILSWAEFEKLYLALLDKRYDYQESVLKDLSSWIIIFICSLGINLVDECTVAAYLDSFQASAFIKKILVVSESKQKAATDLLHIACKTGNLELVKDLIDLGAATDEKQSEYNFNQAKLNCAIDNVQTCLNVSRSRVTPLLIAVVYGHLSVIEYLLRKFAVLNLVPIDKELVLCHAIEYNKIEVLKCLLDNGFKANQILRRGTVYYPGDISAIMLAAVKLNKNIVKLLRSYGAQLTDDEISNLANYRYMSKEQAIKDLE